MVNVQSSSSSIPIIAPFSCIVARLEPLFIFSLDWRGEEREGGGGGGGGGQREGEGGGMKGRVSCKAMLGAIWRANKAQTDVFLFTLS